MKKAIEIAEGVTFYPAHEEHGQDQMTDLVIKIQKLLTKLQDSSESTEAKDYIDRFGHLDWVESSVKKSWYQDYPIESYDSNNRVYCTQRGGHNYVSIIRVDTEIVPKKNKEGFLIKGIARRAMVNISTQKVAKWHDKVTVVVTPTPKGVRYMSFQDGKPFFGQNNIWRACSSMRLDKTSRDMLYARIADLLLKEIKILDIYPELKYFSNYDDDFMMRGILWPTTAMHPFLIKSLGAHTGVKAILNSIYSWSGEKRIQKSSFGGVGEVRNFNDLISAMLWCRALRRLDPQTLANVSQTLPLFQNVGMYNVSLSELVRTADDIDTYFKYFGVGEKAIQTMMADTEESTHYGNRPIMYLVDAIRAFRQIRSRIVRRGIIDHFRRNNLTMAQLHDHISDELQKIRTEDRKISVKKLSEFAGKVSDEIVCVPPKQTHDLIRWGSEYNICIGSYADSVLNGQTYCMGFQKPDGTFWGFAEVSKDMQLRQLLGKHNQPLPNEQRRKIEEYLKAKGVTVPRSYWGSN